MVEIVKPTYGYAPCGLHGCKSKMPLNFDPADFTYRKVCRSCRTKQRTHTLMPFCEHGENLLAPLEYVIPCGCDFRDSRTAEAATWDWIPKDNLLLRTT
jgi:hypothetical protein